jgi:hypothetical protein
MSNANLKKRMSEIISLFEQKELSFVPLIDTIENTGTAIETPYEMIVELRGIVSRLAIEQAYEEEDCASNPARACGSQGVVASCP